MSENELNANEQAKAIRRREKAEPRPLGIDRYIWSNRRGVSAKLTKENFSVFYKWCKENDYNFNSGINTLINTHPSLKDHA